MTIDQYNFACSQYSDPTLPDNEKWKSIDSLIIIENPITLNIRSRIENGKCYFVNNQSTGEVGFYMIDERNPMIELGIIFNKPDVSNIWYMPLEFIDGIVFVNNN